MRIKEKAQDKDTKCQVDTDLTLPQRFHFTTVTKTPWEDASASFQHAFQPPTGHCLLLLLLTKHRGETASHTGQGKDGDNCSFLLSGYKLLYYSWKNDSDQFTGLKAYGVEDMKGKTAISVTCWHSHSYLSVLTNYDATGWPSLHGSICGLVYIHFYFSYYLLTPEPYSFWLLDSLFSKITSSLLIGFPFAFDVLFFFSSPSSIRSYGLFPLKQSLLLTSKTLPWHFSPTFLRLHNLFALFPIYSSFRGSPHLDHRLRLSLQWHRSTEIYSASLAACRSPLPPNDLSNDGCLKLKISLKTKSS